MRVLVTAGATMSMVDKVRAVTNIFRGTTGYLIASHLSYRDDIHVTLLTSDPCVDEECEFMRIVKFKTYQDLLSTMALEVSLGEYDVVIHSAAVSDYEVDGCYRMAESDPLPRLTIDIRTLSELILAGRSLALTMNCSFGLCPPRRSLTRFEEIGSSKAS